FAAQHVNRDEVQPPVAIDVSEIHSHGGVAHVAQGRAWHGAETAMTVVEPGTVGGLKIVADIDVRKAILVNIADLHGQAKVQRSGGYALVIFIAKKLRPLHRCEMAPAIVEIEHVLLSQLDKLPIDDLESPRVAARPHWLAIDHIERQATSLAQDRLDAKVSDI